MNTCEVYRLRLKATDNTFCMQTLETGKASKKSLPSVSPDDAVSPAIIGYWVDLVDNNCRVLYRRFINDLPLNLPHSWQRWGKRKRQRANYVIEVPALPEACYVQLYEQRIGSPEHRFPEKQRHFQCAIASEFPQAITNF